jgi:hypothetical protein
MYALQLTTGLSPTATHFRANALKVLRNQAFQGSFEANPLCVHRKEKVVPPNSKSVACKGVLVESGLGHHIIS